MSDRSFQIILFNSYTTITTGVILGYHNIYAYCGAIPPCHPHAVVSRQTGKVLLLHHICNQAHAQDFIAVAPNILFLFREIALSPFDGVLRS